MIRCKICNFIIGHSWKCHINIDCEHQFCTTKSLKSKYHFWQQTTWTVQCHKCLRLAVLKEKTLRKWMADMKKEGTNLKEVFI